MQAGLYRITVGRRDVSTSILRSYVQTAVRYISLGRSKYYFIVYTVYCTVQYVCTDTVPVRATVCIQIHAALAIYAKPAYVGGYCSVGGLLTHCPQPIAVDVVSHT